MIWLRDHLPADAIIYQRRGQFRRLDPPLLPLPPLRHPFRAGVAVHGLWRAGRGGDASGFIRERRVVAISGDGDFLMNGQEFATAVQYGLPIIALVLDNGMYGTIRLHQERELSRPGLGHRLWSIPISPPWARSFGGFGATVEKTRRLRAAFLAAEASACRPHSCEIRCRRRGAGHNLKRRSRAGQSLIFPRRAAFPARRPPPRASARSRSCASASRLSTSSRMAGVEPYADGVSQTSWV